MQYHAPPAPPRHPHTLVVEPDAETQQMLELALSVRGHIVTTCASAAEALAILQDSSHGIIIIDSRLSDANGFDLAREIRATHGDRPVIVVLANDRDDEDGHPSDGSSIDDVFPWPADMHQLRQRFDRIENVAADRALSSRAATLDRHDAPLLVLSPNGAIRSAGPAAESLFGFPQGAMPGANGFSFFHPDDAAALLSIVTESLVTPGATRAVEVRVRREGDTWRTIAITATNLLGDPNTDGIALSLKGPDTTVDLADQITRGGLHDPVSGLPNVALFHDRIDHAIARGARHDHPVIVMTIDFNRFQDESGLGQAVDDGLFVALSQRLRSCLRMSDTVARLGYDEFGILLEEIVDPGNVRVVADRLIQTLDIPFYDDGREKQLAPHIGVAVSALDRFRAEDLIRDANIARAWARIQGSGRYVVFDPSMTTPHEDRVTGQFSIADVMAAVGDESNRDSASVDDRLTRLQERLNALERDIERMGRLGTFGS